MTLNANGGTVSGAATVFFPVEYGKYTSQAGAARTVSRTGYTLVGWFDDDGNMVFDAHGYAVDGEYWNGSYEPGKTSATWKYLKGVTAYARWDANTYEVTLDPSLGSGGTASITATYDAAMPTITPPTRTGYTFTGYFYGNTEYYNDKGTSAHIWNIAASATLHAQWTLN